MDDLQIIDLFFQRNEQAIVETAAKYGQQLHRMSVRITGNNLDAEECVNDTYLDTWNHIPPHRPQFFFAFLAKILRHKSLDLCQRKHAQKRNYIVVELSQELESCVSSPKSVEDALEHNRLVAAINTFLRTLDDHNQYIFVRRYFFLDAIPDISKATHKTQSSITSSLHRTKQKPKIHLQKEGFTV